MQICRDTLEVMRQNVWDTIVIHGGYENISFFAQPLGQTADVVRNGSVIKGNKSYSETNIYSPFCDQQRDISFKHVTLDIEPVEDTPTSEKEKYQIQRFGVLKFMIVDKVIFYCPAYLLKLPTINDV